LPRCPGRTGRLMRASAVALGGAAPIALGLLLLSQSGSSTPRTGPASHAAVVAASLDDLNTPLALAALRAGQEHRANALSASRARSVGVAHATHPRAKTQPAKSTTGPSNVDTIPVRYTPPTTSTGGSPTSSSQTERFTTPTPPHPTLDSSEGTAHSSPVSAFGASGALGPGSSPNG
jgi:hypothetical protein